MAVADAGVERPGSAELGCGGSTGPLRCESRLGRGLVGASTIPVPEAEARTVLLCLLFCQFPRTRPIARGEDVPPALSSLSARVSNPGRSYPCVGTDPTAVRAAGAARQMGRWPLLFRARRPLRSKTPIADPNQRAVRPPNTVELHSTLVLAQVRAILFIRPGRPCPGSRGRARKSADGLALLRPLLPRAYSSPRLVRPVL